VTFIHRVWCIFEKDLRAEFRTREIFSTMLTFALLVVVVFGLAFDPTANELTPVFPGLLWTAYLFAGMLGLNRSFEVEKSNDAIQGLMLTPVDRSAIYFGKALGNLFFTLVTVLISTPLFFAFFNQALVGSLWEFAIVILVGTIGFVEVGTFLAALTANTRTSELLLPLILFPIVVPVVLASVRLTVVVMAGQSLAAGGAELWLRLLVVYDLVFFVVPFLLFEYLLEV